MCTYTQTDMWFYYPGQNISPCLAKRDFTSRCSPLKEYQGGASQLCFLVYSLKQLPSGEHTNSYGKSPFLMEQSTINDHFQLLC